MLTESLIAATLSTNPPSQHLSAALKDVGIFIHELQPQSAFRQGFKKSSVQAQCLAISHSHVFAAQSGKAVVNVYSRDKGNQESTVPFPDKIRSILYAEGPEVLILGTEEGKLVFWEVGTGRISTSTAAHLQAITHLCLAPGHDALLSGSPDSTVQIWSLSRLISFAADVGTYSGSDDGNAPVAAFAQHRAPILALTCGHSKPGTNFAVSAAEDSACHIWHIQTCQVLRTVLLPSIPSCIIMDPADRAAYLGDVNGGVVAIDIMGLGKSTIAQDGRADLPTHLTEQELWKPSSEPGATHCIGLSYYSSFLVSGHASGLILKWDIAKRKVATEVSRVGQPITNLAMMQPEGLAMTEDRSFQIPEVVKPKLEFNAQLENGTSNVPASYKLQAILTGNGSSTADSPTVTMLSSMTSDGWSEASLSNAVQAVARSACGSFSQSTGGSQRRTEALEKEVADLKRDLTARKDAELQRMERSLERMTQRDDIDLQRRTAYHEAIRQGKDKATANAEMQAVMDASKPELDRVDAESDAEAFE